MTLTKGTYVTGPKLGPGVWLITEVYEYGYSVTLNGIRHIREKEWFKPATPEQVAEALANGHHYD